ncbi:MAG: AbrB/MazE/SpoVT family DNA-binding domain-containing protein [Anaerolineales bacterium]
MLFHREGETSRKIFRSGSSLVVTLPKDMLAYLEIGEGDEVHLRLEAEQCQILVKPAESPAETSKVDREYASQMADIIEKYRPALVELRAMWGH